MVARIAMPEGASARGVRSHHAADRAVTAASRIGSEAPACFAQNFIQVAVHHAWLNAHGVRANFHDLAEMFAEIDNEAVPQRLSGYAAADSSWNERHMMLRGIANQRLHILLIARNGDA